MRPATAPVLLAVKSSRCCPLCYSRVDLWLSCYFALLLCSERRLSNKVLWTYLMASFTKLSWSPQADRSVRKLVPGLDLVESYVCRHAVQGLLLWLRLCVSVWQGGSSTLPQGVWRPSANRPSLASGRSASPLYPTGVGKVVFKRTEKYGMQS